MLTANTIAEAERKLKRVKIALLRNDKFAFWRGVMMIGETTVKDDMPTAATDGRNEFYGREFLNSQTEKQIAWTILHENWHKVERHLTTWEGLYKRDRLLANIACDHRINLMLYDLDPTGEDIVFPTNPDGSRLPVFDERFRGKSIVEIFRILEQEQKNSPSGPSPSIGKGFDDHQWEEANAASDEEKAAHEKEIDHALRQGEMEHRKVHGNGQSPLSDFMAEILNPKINWREALADFFRENCTGNDKSTWRKPSRRHLANDIVLPSHYSERIGCVAYCPDMSGSISPAERNAMVTELVGLARQATPDALHVCYWDTAVTRHEEYNEDNLDLLATSTKPTGGGGTQPACLLEFFKAKNIRPEAVIVLTDGAVPSWPNFNCPTFWVITRKGITAPNGISVYMDPDTL